MMQPLSSPRVVLWLVLLLSAAANTLAQTPKPAETPPTARQEIERWIASSEKDILGLAEDMPDDKYNFVPTGEGFRGVRSFAKQLKHVGAVLQLVSANLLNEKETAEMADERGPDSARTKDEVIKYVKDSYAYLRKAAVTIDEKTAFAPIKNPFGKTPLTRITLINLALVHSANHYGQMVEYLRMNNIKPRGSM
jgi:hypothetical protein